MKNKLRVLVTAELSRPKMRFLHSNFLLEYAGYAINREVMSRDELKVRIADADILVCEYDTIDEKILLSANNLKLIICCRGGVGSVIDLKAARSRGVVVCNTAGRNADAVSDLILGYIFDLTRNITKTNNLMHSRVLTGKESTKPLEYKDVVWGLGNDSPFIRYRGRSISHMTLGIIGFGHAGRSVARKCSALGMKVMTYSPHALVSNMPSYVTAVAFEELLATSDIISMNCALNDSTRNMCDAAFFSAMKRGAYFINTSRGEAVVEKDLAEALKSGWLAGAALDVTRVEPLPSDSPLIGVPNLILTPHVGGSSDDVQMQGTEMVIKTLVGWIEGSRLENCVLGGGTI